MISFLRTRRLSIILLLLDIVIALFAIFTAYSLRFRSGFDAVSGMGLLVVLLMIASMYISNAYHLRRTMAQWELIKRCLIAWVISFACAAIVVYTIGREHYDPFIGRGILALTFAIFFVCAFGVRHLFLRLWVFDGTKRRWLVLGSQAAFQRLQHDAELAGFSEELIYRDVSDFSAHKPLERDELDDEQWVGIVVEAMHPMMHEIGRKLANLRFSGQSLMTISEFNERYMGLVNLQQMGNSWFLDASGFILARASLARRFKGLVDYLFAALLFVVLLPMFAIVAIIVRLDSPGPIFYRQTRVGVHHVNYRVFKFRTMVADAERDGPQWSPQGDPRITRAGRWLRRYRIDEVPQLLNVLLGDMSLIGPRPERPEIVNRLADLIPYYEARHLVKPGITGWAQVRYPYGSSDEDAERKLQYDLYYIKHYSVLLDMLIVFRTIRIILSGSGR